MVAVATATITRFPRVLLRDLSSMHHLPCARRTSTFKSKPLYLTAERLLSLSAGHKSNMISSIVCGATRRKPPSTAGGVSAQPLIEGESNFRRLLQGVLWFTEGLYIFWLFLLPFAPGDPVWAITSETINHLVELSLNFFFILPLMNTLGIYLINAPILHPMSEGLFNFVIGWTLMFAPVLFTDSKRDRYKGSLDILWGFQMFLTNTFLIPYMAIRLNDSTNTPPRRTSQLGSIMRNGAGVVGLIGGSICLMSILWSVLGRSDGNFGGITERWNFLVSYVGSERLAYAFIWDICLYTIFQPWLIGDNLENVKKTDIDKVELVKYLRFVPVVGLVAYLYCLDAVDKDD